MKGRDWRCTGRVGPSEVGVQEGEHWGAPTWETWWVSSVFPARTIYKERFSLEDNGFDVGHLGLQEARGTGASGGGHCLTQQTGPISPGANGLSPFPVPLEASPPCSQPLFHTLSTFHKTLTFLPTLLPSHRVVLPLLQGGHHLASEPFSTRWQQVFPRLTPPSWISKPSLPGQRTPNPIQTCLCSCSLDPTPLQLLPLSTSWQISHFLPPCKLGLLPLRP